jgi:hypothetical protein
MTTVTELRPFATDQPSIGRIVLVKTHGEQFNNQDEHAAIITQVWSGTCINATVFPGSGEPFVRASIQHESTFGVLPEIGTSWRWPPRI